MSKAKDLWVYKLRNGETIPDVEAAYTRFIITQKRDEFVEHLNNGSYLNLDIGWDGIEQAIDYMLRHQQWWQQFEDWSVSEIEYEELNNAG